MTKQIVLLVDEESVVMQFYVRALQQKGFEVAHYLEVDAAFDYFQNNKDDIAIVVLDIMMPSGERYINSQTDDGLKTGWNMYRDIRAKASDLPVIMLTNVDNEETLDLFLNEKNVIVVQKLDFPPFSFVELLKKTLQ